MLLAVLPPSPAPIVYRTSIVRRFENIGTTGTLRIWVTGGVVRGIYQPDSGNLAPASVSGGKSGRTVWLDIPTLGGLHVEGTLVNGAIKGLGTPRFGDAQYVFTATPQPTP